MEVGIHLVHAFAVGINAGKRRPTDPFVPRVEARVRARNSRVYVGAEGVQRFGTDGFAQDGVQHVARHQGARESINSSEFQVVADPLAQSDTTAPGIRMAAIVSK